MFIAYVATLALQARRWALSIFLFSLAVSVKMNVLLMAPGVLAVVLKEANPRETLQGVAAGVILQVILGAPFLLSYPYSYVSRAFEFSRIFLYTWTVNWRFLPEGFFVSSRFALLLLAVHLRVLWSFAQYRWFAEEGGIFGAFTTFLGRWSTTSLSVVRGDDKSSENKKQSKLGSSNMNNDRLLYIIFISNFVGIVCARSLHYQFYSWYFHMLPFILLRTKLPTIVSIGLVIAIEAVWNFFPPSAVTSTGLFVMHLATLWAAWAHGAAYPMESYSISCSDMCDSFVYSALHSICIKQTRLNFAGSQGHWGTACIKEALIERKDKKI